jgi:SNF2 family DNA or RNA helicase
MSLEVDGYTMLFYDKYAANGHNYDNPFTVKMTLNSLFSADDYVQLNSNDAITEFNKYGGVYNIPIDLDKQLYQVIMFIMNDANGNFHKGSNVIKYTVIGINNELLKKYIIEKTQIPFQQFLIGLCRYHNNYNRARVSGSVMATNINTNTFSTDIITTVKSKTGDVVDKMHENPEFLKCQLFPYQKRSVYWMLKRETEQKTIVFNINDEVIIGDVFYDALKQSFTTGDDRKKMTFHGGGLIDEVGLGKTVQTLSLSLLNPPTNISYIRPTKNKLFSRATLVMCPNQLCGQWKREIEKMVNINDEFDIKIVSLLTKPHFDKCTYQDLLDADFVIISYSFLDNPAYLETCIKYISKKKK